MRIGAGQEVFRNNPMDMRNTGNSSIISGMPKEADVLQNFKSHALKAFELSTRRSSAPLIVCWKLIMLVTITRRENVQQPIGYKFRDKPVNNKGECIKRRKKVNRDPAWSLAS